MREHMREHAVSPIKVIKTSVPCPVCGDLICNLCLFNSMCQECRSPIDKATAEAAEKELEAMTAEQPKGVVHVDRRSTAGHAVENAERQAYRWHSEGCSVAPVPADDQTHPYNKPCPICSGRASRNDA